MSIETSVGSPGTVSGASGGFTYALNNISTTPAVVIGIDAARVSITFHNPGDVDILVAQQYVQNTGSDVLLVPSPSARGGCYLVFANGGTLRVTGECQKAWQAFSVSGSGKPLTIQPSRT